MVKLHHCQFYCMKIPFYSTETSQVIHIRICVKNAEVFRSNRETFIVLYKAFLLGLCFFCLLNIPITKCKKYTIIYHRFICVNNKKRSVLDEMFNLEVFQALTGSAGLPSVKY